MNKEQLEQQSVNTYKQRDVNVREVSNGFALTGIVRYVDADTNTVRIAQTSECIATSKEAVVEEVKNFYINGKFGS